MAKTRKSGKRARDEQTRRLVPLEKRLRGLRKKEAKQRRQLDGVHAQAEKAAAQMAGILTDVKVWLGDQPETQAEPASPRPPRTGIRRLIGS